MEGVFKRITVTGRDHNLHRFRQDLLKGSVSVYHYHFQQTFAAEVAQLKKNHGIGRCIQRRLSDVIVGCQGFVKNVALPSVDRT